MSPPVEPASTTPAQEPPEVTPYRLQVGTGYTSMDLGQDAPLYEGPYFEGRIGQAFRPHRQHHFFLNGVFRLSELSTSNVLPSRLSVAHFGMEAGYEVHPAPNIFSLFVYLGFGANIFHTQDLDLGWGPSRILDNTGAFALTLGGGFTLGRGILMFTGGWQPVSPLAVPGIGADRDLAYNPQSFFVGGALDLAHFIDWAGGRMTNVPSFDSFMDGLQTPRFLLFGDAGFQLTPPLDGDPSLRMAETRITLQRPSDESSPLGFGLNLAAGIGTGVEPAAPDSERLSGPYFEFEEAYLHLRLPIGRGVLVQGGKVYMANQSLANAEGVYFTTLGLEDHEAPLNNQISHSYLFHYAFPLTFGGARVHIPFSDSVILSFGSLHDWDNLYGPQSGNAGYTNLTVHIPEAVAFSAGLFGGTTAGDPYFQTNLQMLLCLPHSGNCSLSNPNTRFNLGSEYTFGHQERGDWHAWTIFSRLNFNQYVGLSARGEAFIDSRGVRTGLSQTLGEISTGLNVQPTRWLRFQLEHRHNWSTAPFFPSGDGPTMAQDSFALGGALVL